MTAFGIITAAVIWTKLRLVGDVPRTAYAEPEARQPHGGGGPIESPRSDPARDE